MGCEKTGWVYTKSEDYRDYENKLVKQYHDRLLQTLLRAGGEQAHIEDVAQETWRIVIEKLRCGEIRDREKIKPFILQVGKNQLIMHYRRSSISRERYVCIEDDTPSNSLNPEQETENLQLQQAICSVHASLPVKRDKDILAKVFLTPYSKRSLCEEYNLSPAHFDRVIYRAKARYKELWDKAVI